MEEVAGRLRDERAEPLVVVQQAVAAVQQASATRAGASVGSYAEGALEALEYLEAAVSGRLPPPALTGLAALDRATGGLHRGQLCYLAASTGGGKTALAQQIAEHTASVELDAARLADRQPRRVLIFSREMRRRDLLLRVACGAAGVPTFLAMAGRISREQVELVTGHLGRLHDLPVDVHDGAECSPLDVRAEVLRAEARGGVALVVVDYVQLLDPVARDASESRQVSELSRALQKLSVECDVPVLGLSQFNRSAAGSASPDMHHLKGSSSLEQDAAAAWILQAEPLQKDADGRPVYAPTRRVALNVAKQRFGPFPITVPLVFHRSRVRFEEDTDATRFTPEEEQ